MLTIKGKEYYKAYVQQEECNCGKCVCKYQFSCINCRCCIKRHLEPIAPRIRTEVIIEWSKPYND